MLAILFTSLFLLNCIRGELTPDEKEMDDYVVKAIRISDADNLCPEVVDEMKEACSKVKTKNVLDKLDKIKSMYNSPYYDEHKKEITKLLDSKVDGCELADQGKLDELVKLAAEVNKHVTEAEKWRFGLMTYLNEATKPETKTTLPELTCMLKKFIDKVSAVYPETDGTRKFIQTVLKGSLEIHINALENGMKVKATDSCELSTATSNPSEFKSFLMLTWKAITNLLNKKIE